LPVQDQALSKEQGVVADLGSTGHPFRNHTRKSRLRSANLDHSSCYEFSVAGIVCAYFRR